MNNLKETDGGQGSFANLIKKTKLNQSEDEGLRIEWVEMPYFKNNDGKRKL